MRDHGGADRSGSDDPSVQRLLDEVQRELVAAAGELDEAHESHRRVEGVLEGILAVLPLALVVIDERGMVRAATARADERWGDGAALLGRRLGARPLAPATLDAVVSGIVDDEAATGAGAAARRSADVLVAYAGVAPERFAILVETT